MEFEYDFNKMVDEAYLQLDNKKRGSLLILPNIITEIGTTRLHWKNVKEYLKTISRNPDHFIDYLRQQMPGREINWFSGSKSDGLIIHGRFQKQNEISELAIKYVKEYVSCPSCNKTESLMRKLESKMYEFECLSCGMKKYVN